MEIWATPIHPPLHTYTNSSLASFILVQLSDLCNLGFAVHVQYSITNTCWRHARYWGVCRGASHLPNSLIYKKSPPNCCLWAKEVWRIGNFMYFWTKKWLKIQGRVLFCQICTLWGKKKLQNFCKMPTFRKSGRDQLLKNLYPQTKILGMGLVEASQMHRLRKQGGLRELSPSIFWGGGLEYPLAPPKILYP